MVDVFFKCDKYIFFNFLVTNDLSFKIKALLPPDPTKKKKRKF